jgi:hypothetical protein
MKEDKNNIHQELNEIAPFLAQLREKETGLKAPEGYFNHFEDNLLARIKAEEAAENWANPSTTINEPQPNSWFVTIKNWLLKPQVGISFAILLIVGIASGIWIDGQTSDEGLMAISSLEATEYIQEHIDQFSETLIIETVAEDDWATIEFSDDFEMDNEFDEYIEEGFIDELDSELMDELL